MDNAWHRMVRSVLAALVTVAALGCGPRLVQPGTNPAPLPAPAPASVPQLEGPVLPDQPGPALDVGGVPRVPASSVVTIPDSSGPARDARYHTVERGDTLTAIARRYGTTVGVLIEANGLDQDAVIRPGQLIYIPQ
jgi:LysM domain